MRPLPRLLSVSTLGGALIASLLVGPSLVAPALAADPAVANPAVTDPARGTITWGACPAEGFDGFECGGHPGEDDVPNFIVTVRMRV